MFAASQKWPSGPLRLERDRRVAPPRCPASRSARRLGLRAVRAQPVVRARELPRRLEVARIRPSAARPSARGRLSALARSSRCAYSASARAAASARLTRARPPAERPQTITYNRPSCRISSARCCATLGEDPRREGLVDTPRRVEKSLQVPDQRIHGRHRSAHQQRAVHGRLQRDGHRARTSISTASASTTCCRSSASATSPTCRARR